MAGTALKRLMAEYKQLTLNPPEGIVAGPANEENFFEWEALIMRRRDRTRTSTVPLQGKKKKKRIRSIVVWPGDGVLRQLGSRVRNNLQIRSNQGRRTDTRIPTWILRVMKQQLSYESKMKKDRKGQHGLIKGSAGGVEAGQVLALRCFMEFEPTLKLLQVTG
ncbi:ubiquitin-conjugating enzyme E2 G2 isoform X2 [Oryzias melastigma]|uniref:ubiquitin-conjugating enzyme E2 G2 isoform X2 n=1 Tax=Oryzias melastigma TaxID=30732 RepID=UPI000CF8387D|nr:ubiquitin-conjugating enzyme E2 G2 isoform X2 [Oryzias melastigma]